MKVIEGLYSGKGKKIAIVASRFNSVITEKLIDGSCDVLKRHEVEPDDIFIYWVPGAFEIPAIVNKIQKKTKDISAIICLGAVIRGETPHFDYVSSEVSKGIANISINGNIPIIYGIITADTQEQAFDRAGVKLGNKGFEAAMSALEMISLYSKLDHEKMS